MKTKKTAKPSLNSFNLAIPAKVDVCCEDVVLSDFQLQAIESVIDEAQELESLESEFYRTGRKDLSDKIRLLLESVDYLKDRFFHQVCPGEVK